MGIRTLPSVSVVIPVYNTEKYIAKCIDSVLNQTYKDYEIIVVDDGSTDGTGEILKRYYHDGKIRWYYKNNGGTASALNVGIEKMKGRWFKWLSADDMLLPDALENMMKAISIIGLHDKRFLFYTDYDIIDKNDKVMRIFNEPERTHLGTDLRNAELYHNFYGNGSTSIIHKNIIDKVGKFREGMQYGEDYEYWLRACLKYKMTLYHLPFITTQYRVHDESLTSTKNQNDNLNVVSSLKKEYKKYLTKDQCEYLKTLDRARPFKSRMIRKLPNPFRKATLTVYQSVKNAK